MLPVLLSLLLLAAAAPALGDDTNLRRLHALMTGGLQASAAPLADDVATHFFEQRLDHFAASDARTWPQRYYVNEAVYDGSASAPTFLYVGGESELTAHSVAGGEILELATTSGARVVGLEHRFYGESQPFNYSATPEELHYLSAEQALADLNHFVSVALNGTTSGPLVTVGGSYPGALSAWARLKYPATVYASLASSGPVLAKEDFYEYDEVVARGLGPACADAVRAATASIETALEKDANATKTAWQCPADTGDVAFLYVLADTVAYAVQYGTDKEAFCANMTRDGADVVDVYRTYTTGLFASQPCQQWNLEAFTAPELTPSSNMRQWLHQCCTDFGWWQTAPAENSLRSTRITVEWHNQMCVKLFGEDGTPAGGPRSAETNARYGGQTIPGASRIVAPQGSADPWSTFCLSESRAKAPDFVERIVIQDGTHCSDLSGLTPGSSASKKAAVEKIASYMAVWAKREHCAVDCHGHGECLTLDTCACTGDYVGDDCKTKSTSTVKPSVQFVVPLIAAVGALCLGIAVGFGVGRARRGRSDSAAAYRNMPGEE